MAFYTQSMSMVISGQILGDKDNNNKAKKERKKERTRTKTIHVGWEQKGTRQDTTAQSSAQFLVQIHLEFFTNLECWSGQSRSRLLTSPTWFNVNHVFIWTFRSAATLTAQNIAISEVPWALPWSWQQAQQARLGACPVVQVEYSSLRNQTSADNVATYTLTKTGTCDRTEMWSAWVK